MPRVSAFLGIAIYIYYDDHPPPHFHAIYAGQEAVIHIRDLRILKGGLPPRVFGLVLEWAFQHRPELEDNWLRAESFEPLSRIQPLE